MTSKFELGLIGYISKEQYSDDFITDGISNVKLDFVDLHKFITYLTNYKYPVPDINKIDYTVFPNDELVLFSDEEVITDHLIISEYNDLFMINSGTVSIRYYTTSEEYGNVMYENPITKKKVYTKFTDWYINQVDVYDTLIYNFGDSFSFMKEEIKGSIDNSARLKYLMNNIDWLKKKNLVSTYFDNLTTNLMLMKFFVPSDLFVEIFNQVIENDWWKMFLLLEYKSI